MDKNRRIPMLGIDGGVREIPLYLKDSMLDQGWKLISADVFEDLKKKGITYLPNFDLAINKPIDYSRVESAVEDKTLEVEIL